MFGAINFNITPPNCQPRACDNCRVRKIKCPNIEQGVSPLSSKPCDKCVEASLCCTYNQITKKKGPKVSSKKRKLILDQPWEVTDDIAYQHFENEQESHLCFSIRDDMSSPVTDEDTPSSPPNEDANALHTALVEYFQNTYTCLPLVDLADDNYGLLNGLILANLTHEFKKSANHATKTALLSQIRKVHLQKASLASDTISIDSVCDSIFLHMAMRALNYTNRALAYLSKAHTYYHLLSIRNSRTKRLNCLLTNLRYETNAHHLSTDPPNYTVAELLSRPYSGSLAHLCSESYNHQVISLLLWHTSITIGHNQYTSSSTGTGQPQTNDCRDTQKSIQQYLQLVRKPGTSAHLLMKMGELLNHQLSQLSSSQLQMCGTHTLKMIVEMLIHYPELHQLSQLLQFYIDKSETWSCASWLEFPSWGDEYGVAHTV
ncbi:hypothetical protein B0I75DRAFT_116578 [Yarrowia lipolytica]|uniref:YALI0C09009p n=2 Tax=Yarrowia lipolytica TaxID=4952 RepID=Q6CCI7_YARLI|nr:YALI0C09009p [Yarrowia lipolytica CLIB122]RDW25673.1 hypothetical protein B0I71DRAFT_119041 [Yarrowia lipolytica]RDW46215.1 hypothetical protein B0I74DRAFT_111913 [Yarrowia lipolytica]RDW53528.1 hypothetical protein B0I75DRAFT_116578 [Yarrowia lipolytica]CAG81928.1 YALI0C09009p [Yarrowia lipolytica CLIB122]|eukprot:XP_501625.1 YALI0C09009p [Yarrowia lipolytica CLIB122]